MTLKRAGESSDPAVQALLELRQVLVADGLGDSPQAIDVTAQLAALGYE